jgi:hypothetical protein
MNAQIFMFMYLFMWLPAIVSANGPRAKWIHAGLAAGLLVLSYFVPFLSFLSIITAIVLLMVNLNKHLPPAPRKRRNALARVLDVCGGRWCFSFQERSLSHDVHPGVQ